MKENIETTRLLVVLATAAAEKAKAEYIACDTEDNYENVMQAWRNVHTLRNEMCRAEAREVSKIIIEKIKQVNERTKTNPGLR